MSEKDFSNINEKALTVEFYHYNYDDSVIHFKYDEDAECVKPHHVTYTKQEIDTGVKVNIEVVSNGYIVKTGKNTTVLNDTYALKSFIEESVLKTVAYEMSFDELMEKEDDIVFSDMDSTMLRFNVAYQAAA